MSKRPIGTKLATLLAVCVSTCMVPLDFTIVSVAQHDTRTDLGATFSEMAWIVNGYTLTFAAFLLAGGSLADRFGRRRLFALGQALVSLGFGSIVITPDSVAGVLEPVAIGAALVGCASVAYTGWPMGAELGADSLAERVAR